MIGRPHLSVVVASYNSRRTIRACLNSVRAQDFAGSFEVIVVDSSSDGTEALVRDEFPEATLMHCPTRKYPGDARNLGIARSTGDIVCFLDSDCVADPDWLSQIWRCHALQHPVIGGSVSNGARTGVVGWASYFAEFNIWMPGTPAGRLRDLPGCNSTFKRWILDDLGPLDEGDWSEDTSFNWKLQLAGYQMPFFEPAIRVTHDGITDLRRYLAHQVELGKAYGRIRAAMESFDPLRRAAYALAVPLIHLTLCTRATLRVLRNRGLVREFVRACPLVYVGLLAWSVGEGIGYLRGARTE